MDLLKLLSLHVPTWRCFLTDRLCCLNDVAALADGLNDHRIVMGICVCICVYVSGCVRGVCVRVCDCLCENLPC